MGMYLIGETSNLAFVWGIVQVALGLGLVIFVHELGHFLVAKACGVQCDKFFVGFDIGGYKISRKWGETEYGIGILPLGGYVKMLGQDDNPAKAAEEMRKARIHQEPKPLAESITSGGEADDESAEPAENPASAEAAEHDEQFVLHPRSYLAKSVPQRMAIISAGVIMNIIFAVVFATIAYTLGVKYQPNVVSGTIPGSPAWRAGVQVGDRIVKLGDREVPRFRDLMSGVSLGDVENGIPVVIERAGVDEPIQVVLKPKQSQGRPTIGVLVAKSLSLFEDNPVFENTPAAEASPPLEGGDRIIAVDGEAITSDMELVRVLTQKRDKPIQLTVLRGAQTEAVDRGEEVRGGHEKTLVIAPNPMKRLGLVMNMGPITAVQQGSPAETAGLKADDFIEKVNDQPVGDPITLPERLQRMAAAGEDVKLTITRSTDENRAQTVDLLVPLRMPTWYESSAIQGAPLAAPALGIAYRVVTRVQHVDPDSPADKSGIVAGEEVLRASLVPAADDDSKEAQYLAKQLFTVGKEHPNWPAFMDRLQLIRPGMKVKLTIKHGTEERDVELTPVDDPEFFNPERGFQQAPMQFLMTAESFGGAVALGAAQTKDDLLMVYRFLQKLINRDISPYLLGGPGTIAQVAWFSALEGPATLLMFLTMLSANLAVINFLPIPVLDGGHMVFLLLEGIMRRPVSEKIVVAAQLVGFVLIISLMLFVISLDVGIIPRP